MAKTIVKTSHGLARAKELYQNRDQRVKELKSEGKKVFGYLCLFPVLEMVTAADIIPYRILGDLRETITEGDRFLPPLVCPFLRSCVDLGMKGKYDFLDGAVFTHVCDVGRQLHNIWQSIIKLPNCEYIDTPHHTSEAAHERHRALLDDFQSDLELFTGKKLTSAKIKKAIQLHNQQRALVRELYDLRKPDPPLISGTETLHVVKSVMSLPIEEGNALVREVIDEVKQRKNPVQKQKARLLIWGPVIDDTAFIEMVENLGANVVMDDMCVGSRAFFSDVPVTDNPLDGLNEHYLVDIKCPRTMKQAVHGAFKHDHLADVIARFGYIGQFAKDWNVNGVILQSMTYCDTHAYEAPLVKDYLDHVNVKNMFLELDYSEASLAPMRTRIEGFLEVLG